MFPCHLLLAFIILFSLQLKNVEPWTPKGGDPDPSFKAFTVIYPRIIDSRSRRAIPSTKEKNGHRPTVSVAFDALDRNYVLDLNLNRNVVSKNALLRYQRNGTFVADKRALVDDENCYYSGIVRGFQNSSVAVTTCAGISGLVFDGRRTLFVSPSTPTPGGRQHHYLYSEHDLTQNRTCGVDGHAPHLPGRVRRSVTLRGPRASDARSRYVELALVVDNKVYLDAQEDMAFTVRRTKQIANIVNALYAPLNIFVALVGVEVWTEKDEITLSENGDTTLNNFLAYRSKRLVLDIPNDNAQLLTGIEFQGGVVGKALKGPICTLEFSGGVNMDHSTQVSLVATTVAHEMGHNFGMEHDSDECKCKDDRCIMSPSSSSVSPTHWSSCSLHYLTQAFGHGMDYCLRNQPASLYESPVCGNGFVEPGEQCDCGLPADCTNRCCDPSSCMLRPNATCGSGHCCDLDYCKPMPAGVKCRAAAQECDLPEYCTGNSEYCPDDQHKMNGQPCQNEASYCYGGVCRTRGEQCRLIWGPTGSNSVDSCYDQNSKGSRLGNCGYDLFNRTYTRCKTEDVMCGMLHCAHLSEKLEFGMESAAIISASFINIDNKVVPCRTAIIDLGLGSRDPGLVPNGAPCGHKKMCVEQSCVPVAAVTEDFCAEGCSGNGVCNSRGHCHCDRGWGPPFCAGPGDGGSVDSGPALDDSAINKFVIVLFVVFLGVVPVAALIFCCLYFRRYNLSFKETFMLSGLVDVSRKLPCCGEDSRHDADRKKATATKRNSHGRLELTGRLGDARSAAADRDAAAPLTQTDIGSPRDQLASNLLGTFSGFSLKPIRPEDGGPSPAVSPPGDGAEPRRVCEVKPTVLRPGPEKPPPPPPQKGPQGARTTFDMKPAADLHPRKMAVPSAPPGQPPPPQGARTTFDMKPQVEPVQQRAAPEPARPVATDLPTVAVVGSRTTFGMSRRPGADRQHRDEQARPDSDPDKTTARTTFQSHGAVKPLPTGPSPADRPPPPPRPTGAAGTAAASAPVSPTAPLTVPARPLSVVAPLEMVPDARPARSDAGSRSSTLDSSRSDTLRSTGSDGGRDHEGARFGTALSRVSGIFKRGDKSTPGSPDPGDRSGHHPNQSFKAAKIDRDRLKNMEISAPIPQSVSVPNSAVPVGSAPGSPQPAAARPGTLPTSPAGRRSAEAAARAGRPVSFPARPTAPPPRPPPAREPSDNVYDDCNLDAPGREGQTPSDENIYSTIEERPEEEHLYAVPPYEPPSPSGGEDLLSEIAAELHSKDLYAAVDKTRPRPAPPSTQPAALYQNIEDAQQAAETPPPLPPALPGGEAAQKVAPPVKGGASKPVPLAKTKSVFESRRPGRLPEKPPVTAKKPDVRRPPFK